MGYCIKPIGAKGFGMATPLTDSHKEEKEYMDFFKLSLTELEKWKEENKDAQPEELALCDQVTALKKEAEQAKEKAQSMLDEINAKKENEQAQQFLFDEVEN